MDILSEQARAARVDRYLTALEVSLRLPPSVASERLDEIAAHIDDTITSLVEEGLDPEHAEREALARLGSPEVLGNELRRAEQTAGRAIAAVGGGIVAAGGGVIRGSIAGFLALFAILIAGGLVLQAIAQLTGLQVGPWILLSSPAAYVAIAWLAAFFGARSAAEAIAAGSRRRIVDVRPALAVTAAAVGAFVVTQWELEQDWLSVLALLGLPLVAALGPLAAHDVPAGPRQRSRWWIVALGTALLLPIVLLGGMGGQVTQGTSVGQAYASFDEMWRGTGWDRIGRRPADDITSALGDAVRTTGPHEGSGTPDAVAQASLPSSAIGPWSGFRLEVWRAADDPGAGPEINPSAAAPDRVVPLASADGSLTAAVRLDDRPGARGTWAVLTGVGSDGARYVLARDFAWAPFRGTALDWIGAVVH